MKGYLYYDNNHDNPAYDYTWAFVKIPEVSQPIKIRGLQHMNRALDLDEVYLKMVNWLQWEPAQQKFTKHIDFDRGMNLMD